mmetsp:Transcript_63359/g.196614  ORF Transcript_63359/g.196614 Transcript_63359/m.196614 type:complete len:207 (-) Transcript_63359:334-954(-)
MVRSRASRRRPATAATTTTTATPASMGALASTGVALSTEGTTLPVELASTGVVATAAAQVCSAAQTVSTVLPMHPWMVVGTSCRTTWTTSSPGVLIGAMLCRSSQARRLEAVRRTLPRPRFGAKGRLRSLSRLSTAASFQSRSWPVSSTSALLPQHLSRPIAGPSVHRVETSSASPRRVAARHLLSCCRLSPSTWVRARSGAPRCW